MRRWWRADWWRVGRWPAALAAALVLAVAITSPAAAAQDVADGQWWHTQWRMDEVWQVTDGGGATVAILDSGVDADIPELAGAVLPGIDYIEPAGDGRVDRDDENGGHGTGMASLVAAGGDGSGLVGVAPGASVLPVALPTSSESLWEGGGGEVIEAIRWAVDNGADVINMSFGSVGVCTGRRLDAIRYAISHDVVLVAAAGNTPDGPPEVPANCPGVLTVGSTDTQLNPWPGTARHEFVDVAAPGVQLSAVGAGGQVITTSGTSMSTALVAGVAALLRAEFPEASAEQLVARMIATARDTDEPGRDDVTGHGVVRPFHALTESTVPPDTPNPPFEALAAAGPGLPAPPTATSDRTPPPAVAPAPDVNTDDESTGPLVLLAVAGGVLLISAGVVVVLLRRRAAADDVT